jgi:DNA-directed RNA polymerase alpha subunit
MPPNHIARGEDEGWEGVAGLSAPARRALVNAGIDSYNELAKVSEEDLAALHGMGPKAMDVLRQGLKKRGLSFAD